MKQFLLASFPNTTQSLLSEEKGTLVEKRGEGIVLRKCQKIPQYNRKIETRKLSRNISQCFKDIPVRY